METNATVDLAERAQWAAARAQLDPFRPQGCFIEVERAANGELVSVATVLLTNRECPWRCVFCDLWKHTTTATVPRGAIPAQIDFALSDPRAAPCRHVKLYNAGSFFDAKAVPPEDLPAIAARLAGLEHAIVECHPTLVGESAVRFRELLGATSLEVAMGLEVADDTLLEKLNKRMTLASFRRAAEFLVANGIAVRAFVMVQPPFVRTGAEALDWAARSIDFAFSCGASVVSLIPARFGPARLKELARGGEFAPPTLQVLEDALAHGLRRASGRVFVDLWDLEKLGGSHACQPERVARLREINRTQVCPD